MISKRIQVSFTCMVVGILLLASVGAVAATVEQFNTIPAKGSINTAMLGHPVAVAADSSGHIFVMTHRGWIYPLNTSLVVQGNGKGVKMPGANTALCPPPQPPCVDYPAVALAVNANNGHVYAARNDGASGATIVHYDSSLNLQQTATVATTATNTLVGLTVDGSGNYIYAATANGTIVEFNPSLVSQLTKTVTLTPQQKVAAIRADTTGNLYVAISDGTVYRFNTSLATQATGSVSGTPVGIATDPATGNAIVATLNNGLYNVNQSITMVNNSNGLPTNLVGVDLDSSNHVAVADSTGTVYVMNTSLSSIANNTSSGFSPVRSIAITTTGSIYVVGGLDGASEGDPHLTTIDGVRYDFQSAGEFVLFRHKGNPVGPACGEKVDALESKDDDHEHHGEHDAVEIQVRQYPVATTANTCVSLNAAVAVRAGKHKLTYEPNLSGQPDPSGLQLRIDGKLITLDPNGVGFGEGGRIVPTSTPGGLEVDLPDDTILFVTPGWWASQSKWYLNVNVEPERRACGLIGNVPDGSWLPALPDGTSMGPQPTSAHQQYVDRYVRFADAWRVTDKTSLFDYAPGTSTATFTMHGWPPESGACSIPGVVPIQGASEQTAEQACKGVPGDPANCIFDVEITGLTNIANTYVASRNAQPTQGAGKPDCNCPRKNAGGGTVALLTFLGLLALWKFLRRRQVST